HSVAAAGAGVDMDLTGLNGTVAVSNADDFAAYMKKIDDAMVLVNSQLSKIGSLTGSLTFKEDQVSSSQINIEASYNRIMNANMAEEQVNASKLTILQQTSTAMLAQANAAPQFLLSLFK
ncbi:MAG TPA: flagellin protein, partial [Rikenellaceae bacterium]|nr:flagellin protein [Rikenellaceae bacterium]